MQRPESQRSSRVDSPLLPREREERRRPERIAEKGRIWVDPLWDPVAGVSVRLPDARTLRAMAREVTRLGAVIKRFTGG